MKMKYELERAVAISAAIKASALCRDVQAGIKAAERITKADSSPVTVADFGSQALINLEIKKAFPADQIMAEEDSSPLSSSARLKFEVVNRVRRIIKDISEDAVLAAIDLGKSKGCSVGRSWAVDPVDGTKGFLRGGQYAVAIALIEKGKVVVGVLGCPNLALDFRDESSERGSLLIAVQNQGAYMRAYNGRIEKTIHVSQVKNPAKAGFTESYESEHSSHPRAARIAELLAVKKAPLRMDSQCKYALVARGEVAFYLRLPVRADYQEKIWDHAAGSIIVQEAGGMITDINGRALDFSAARQLSENQGIIVTNGSIHEAVLTAAGTAAAE
ncbi:MAG: 3'(2'),5'-bisphosphate nucleotidase [Spirochaeta sp.]|nr:3'(2'),5'-bisphosphate nucleotidase [Spirochaeta sp.]